VLTAVRVLVAALGAISALGLASTLAAASQPLLGLPAQFAAGAPSSIQSLSGACWGMRLQQDHHHVHHIWLAFLPLGGFNSGNAGNEKSWWSLRESRGELRLRAEFAIDKSSLEAWVVIGCCVEGGAVSVQ
jgi:hypothetical protein